METRSGYSAPAWRAKGERAGCSAAQAAPGLKWQDGRSEGAIADMNAMNGVHQDAYFYDIAKFATSETNDGRTPPIRNTDSKGKTMAGHDVRETGQPLEKNLERRVILTIAGLSLMVAVPSIAESQSASTSTPFRAICPTQNAGTSAACWGEPQSLPNGTLTWSRLGVFARSQAGHRPALPLHPAAGSCVRGSEAWRGEKSTASSGSSGRCRLPCDQESSDADDGTEVLIDSPQVDGATHGANLRRHPKAGHVALLLETGRCSLHATASFALNCISASPTHSSPPERGPPIALVMTPGVGARRFSTGFPQAWF